MQVTHSRSLSQILQLIFTSLTLVQLSGCSTSPTQLPHSKSNQTRFVEFVKTHPNSIWAKQLPERTQKALEDYQAHKTLKNGQEYGYSVRTLNLKNRSAFQLDLLLEAMSCPRKDDFLKDPKTHDFLKDSKGLKIPMTVYLCPDGGVVRVKPVGDPTSKFRPQPHASKALRYPADSSFETFEDEALKIDNLGNPLPKWKNDLNIKAASPTISPEDLIEGWAEDAHSDLAPGIPIK